MSPIPYRAEIDGLRALAVLPVIFFHAGFSSFSGGFIGVDVFFVISGYLIAKIILGQLREGSFSLITFYERRIKRILPALFVVIAACIPIGYISIVPSDMGSFFKSIIAAVGFTSNILFWREDGYFDAASELKPLIHTWSLSVEEQYYLLFPPLLLFINHFSKNRVVAVLGLAAASSFLLAIWGAHIYRAAAFYLLPTRAWELLVGAIVAVLTIHGAPRTNPTRLIAEVGTAGGVGLIIISVILFDKGTPWPSVLTSLPVLGAVLIIIYASPLSITGKLLGARPCVLIGLLSYSAYLWHQPIFSFFRHFSLSEPTTSEYISLCCIVFSLAFITWRYVEVPIRRSHSFVGERVFFTSGAITFTFILFGAVAYVNMPDNTAPKWLSQGEFPNEFDGVVVDGIPCSGRDPLYSCRLGNPTSGLRIVIAGDSHARVLTEAVEHMSKTGTFEWIDLTASGCPFLLGMNAYVKGVISGTCTSEYQTKRLSYLSKLAPSIIVLHWRIPLYISGKGFDNQIGGVEFRDSYVMASRSNSTMPERVEEHYSALRRTISALTKLGHRIVVVSAVPTNGWDPKSRLWKLEKFGLANSHEDRLSKMRIPLSAVVGETGLSDKLIFSMKNEFPISVVDSKGVFCDDFYCKGITTDRSLYANRDHLSYDGAMLLFTRVLAEVRSLTQSGN